MTYSTMAQPDVNESRIHEVPKHNGLMFHMGEVSELGRKAMLTMFLLCCLKGDLSEPAPEIDKANV